MLIFDVYEAGESEPLARVNVVSLKDPVVAAVKACDLITEHAGPGNYKAVPVKDLAEGVDMTAEGMVA